MENIENMNRENALDLSSEQPDRTGIWYGKLQAIRQTRKGEADKYNWLCLCVCLKTYEVSGPELDAGDLPFCDCKEVCAQTEILEEKVPINLLRPTWMTQGQIDLMLLIAPGPIGKGMKVVNAAKKLNISENAARLKLKKFAKAFPFAWHAFQNLRDTMRRQGKSSPNKLLGRIKSWERLTKSYGEHIVSGMVRHKF